MCFDQSLVRVRAGTKTDRGGNTVPDWDTATRVTYGAVNVQPNTQVETVNEQRQLVIIGWRVQTDEGTDVDITAADRIEWDDKVLQVDGDVARWPDPLAGGVHHVEFTMKRATG